MSLLTLMLKQIVIFLTLYAFIGFEIRFHSRIPGGLRNFYIEFFNQKSLDKLNLWNACNIYLLQKLFYSAVFYFTLF